MNPAIRPREVLVVGGGISGLAAARQLAELGCSVRLLEAGPKAGGSIETSRRDGFLLESGPESFLTEKPAAMLLCRRLGMQEQIIGTNRDNRRSFIFRGGRLHPTPEGFYLLGPARYLPFIRSGLLSWRGKLRALQDLFLPRRPDDSDESLASFVRRRLGEELLTYLAQPLVAGIYTADAEKLSLRATFPVFMEIERRYRSVILGLRRRSAARRAEMASGARYGLFASLEEGLGKLVAAMGDAVPEGTILFKSRVTRLSRAGARWRLETAAGGAHEAQAVLLALPAHASGDLLRDLDGRLAALLNGIPYATSVTVNLAYRKNQVTNPLAGFGFVVPQAERRRLLACTFSSTKFPGRAPAEHVLLRAFLGGALWPEAAEASEEQLAEWARTELAEILEISGEPVFSTVSRHPKSMPQYQVGHQATVAEIRARAEAFPGLALAGNGFEGIGLPDCIRTAEAAAQKLAGATG